MFKLIVETAALSSRTTFLNYFVALLHFMKIHIMVCVVMFWYLTLVLALLLSFYVTCVAIIQMLCVIF